MIKDTNKVGKLKLPNTQKSMDDDNPTVPVNRGAAGVYMPEPNEKQRAKTGVILALERYMSLSNCDFDVFDISANGGNVYEVSITRKR